jgi:sulfur carrier protein ThiS
MIEAKVIRVPGAVKEVALNDGAAVADALQAAGVTVASGEVITVNGSAANQSTTLYDGDKVYVAKGAKGNR